jgi:hypothetical protein
MSRHADKKSSGASAAAATNECTRPKTDALQEESVACDIVITVRE